MIAAALALAAAAPAPLACGAVTRPGIAELGADGVWRGRAVALCRAVAAQANGPQAPVVFHSYDSLAGLRAAGEDGIAFVSAAELAVLPAASALNPGPTAAVERQVLVVPAASPARSPRDLAGRMICFIIGTRAEDALDAWATQAAVPIERLGFQEEGEMADAYAVGKCAALAVDAQDAPADPASRVLGPALATTTIVAATPARAGTAWRRAVTAIIARTPEAPADR